MRKKSVICGVALVASTGDAFHQGLTNSATHSKHKSSTALNGLFDGFKTGGSGNSEDDLDAQWEAQQRMLKMRKGSTADKNKYFEEIEERRMEATKKQKDMWSWQTKNYAKGEDPITEWKKKRKEGVISDLEDQYGDPKEVGGIPIPGASFGVGGEFGVGGKFDNGGRFDLRLPYADQGYVDEDADVMAKIGSFFGGKKKKEEPPPPPPEPPKKKWPWEK